MVCTTTCSETTTQVVSIGGPVDGTWGMLRTCNSCSSFSTVVGRLDVGELEAGVHVGCDLVRELELVRQEADVEGCAIT